MRKFYQISMALLLLMCITVAATAQQGKYPLGDTKSFRQSLRNELRGTDRAKVKPVVKVRVSTAETLALKVNVINNPDTETEYLIGEVQGIPGSSFFIRADGKKLVGNIILKNEKRGYRYLSDESGNAFIEAASIDDLLCVNYESMPVAPQKGAANAVSPMALTNLESFPGARGCVLLDFDGHYVSGTPWNNGNPINAAPSGMSDALVQEAWEVVAEDFRPFHLNVTTNEAVFNSYPKTMRMRCIITPTNTAAPGAGGVAYIGSFNWNDDTPCWVFVLSGKGAGEASSHEIGHTFGLGHDGRTNPNEGYFAGHGDWAPIMGVGYYEPITQWSRGEYNFANNTEDDLTKISSATYNVGYRNDDYGNSTGAATAISSGSVNRSGIIERTSDVDFFSFNSGAGTISLNINTVARHGDLDIIARLYNSAGSVIATSNPAGLNASISASVSAGTYYLSVDNTGAGNPATDGYSDYASLGSYFITGNIPVGTSGGGVVTVYQDCNYGGTAVGLPLGDYTMTQLASRGVPNDWISSLKVSAGYEIVVYQNENFAGASQTFRADDACLVDNGINDWITSVRVRTAGVTTLAGKYFLQNRHSGLYLDVSGPSTADGANVIQWTGTSGTNQQFEFSHLGGGTYRLTPVHSGKSLDIDAISTADGAHVIQWSYVGGGNQQFIAVSTGDGFYKLIAKHSNKIVEVAGFSTTAGGQVQQWTDNGQASGQWKLIPVSAAFSSTIQAENYSAMSGVQTETTTDAGGGLNVGWIDNTDWMAYSSITIPVTGSYRIDYRVASGGTGGQLSLDVNAGAQVLGTLAVPATGGWQTWTTISHTVNITAGTYDFGIFASTGGWNLNWWSITQVGAASSAVAQISEEPSNEFSTKLELSPNPARYELAVKADPYFVGGQMHVIDATGAASISKIYDGNKVDISALKTGLYIFMIHKNGRRVAERFVKE